jgi:hypothetical protein
MSTYDTSLPCPGRLSIYADPKADEGWEAWVRVESLTTHAVRVFTARV